MFFYGTPLKSMYKKPRYCTRHWYLVLLVARWTSYCTTVSFVLLFCIEYWHGDHTEIVTPGMYDYSYRYYRYMYIESDVVHCQTIVNTQTLHPTNICKKQQNKCGYIIKKVTRYHT